MTIAPPAGLWPKIAASASVNEFGQITCRPGRPTDEVTESSVTRLRMRHQSPVPEANKGIPNENACRLFRRRHR
jgi:hypothetical protein